MVKTNLMALFALTLIILSPQEVPAQSNSLNGDNPEVGEDTVFFDCPNEYGIQGLGEHYPEFPGGEDALIRFITDNTVYPQTAIDDSITGKVLAVFVVNTDGSVDDIRIYRGIRSDIDSACYRVIKAMPDWKPGGLVRKAGKGFYLTKYRISYSLPIMFTLDTLTTRQGIIITPKRKPEHGTTH